MPGFVTCEYAQLGGELILNYVYLFGIRYSRVPHHHCITRMFGECRIILLSSLINRLHLENIVLGKILDATLWRKSGLPRHITPPRAPQIHHLETKVYTSGPQELRLRILPHFRACHYGLLLLFEYRLSSGVHIRRQGQGRKYASSDLLDVDYVRLLTLIADEELIKYGWEEDVWFHVDNLSSAHIYVRLPEGQDWETIDKDLLVDCAQLTKANSIEGVLCNPRPEYERSDFGSRTDTAAGNKKDNITIVYTPWSNLKKDGSMAVGQVSFKDQRKVGLPCQAACHYVAEAMLGQADTRREEGEPHR